MLEGTRLPIPTRFCMLLSDHSPIYWSFSRKLAPRTTSEKIPVHICKHPDFKRFVDNVVCTPEFKALHSFEKLATAKAAFKDASMYVRQNLAAVSQLGSPHALTLLARIAMSV